MHRCVGVCQTSGSGVRIHWFTSARAHNPDMPEMRAMRRRAGQTGRLMTTAVGFERRGHQVVDAYYARSITEEKAALGYFVTGLASP